MLAVTAPAFKDLLKEDRQYFIPKYQRAFAWRINQATELLEDLLSYSDTGSSDNLFLGTCILKQSQDGIEVVDGQQRFTTLILVLVACRSHAKSIERHQVAGSITERINTTNYLGSSVGPKLAASPTIKDLFDQICSSEWMGDFPEKIGKKQVRRQVKLLKPLYDYFLQEIKKLNAKQFERLLQSIYESRFIRIEVQDSINALSIFERTNARGKDLEVSDLLKNYLFQTENDEVEEKWEQITECADGQMQRMLKYYYVSQLGAVRKKDLYSQIKTHAKGLSPSAFLERLLGFGRFFQVFRNGNAKEFKEYFDDLGCKRISEDQNVNETIYLSVSALRAFGVMQPIPVIAAAINCMMRNNPDQYKPLARLVNALERYHFTNNIICTRIGNEVEKLYADSCAEFGKSSDLNSTVDKLLLELRRQRAKESEFVEQFIELEYSESNIPWIAYVYDRIQNHEMKPGSRIVIYDPDNKGMRRRKYDIEHFAPRNPKTPYSREMQATIDNIGNLIVLSEDTNKKLQNKPACEKYELLIKAPDSKKFIFVQEFVHELSENGCEWTRDRIVLRSRGLAEKLYKEVLAF